MRCLAEDLSRNELSQVIELFLLRPSVVKMGVRKSRDVKMGPLFFHMTGGTPGVLSLLALHLEILTYNSNY